MSVSTFDPDKYPVLWVQSNGDLSARINFMFARKWLTKFVIRMTGGSNLMSAEDAERLSGLRTALEGFTGVGLFGGTSTRSRQDPNRVIDTVTEVFPSLKSRTLKIGVVAKHSDMRVTPHGVVVHNDPASSMFSTLNVGADAILLTQPSADHHAMWTDEYKECIRIVDALQKVDWGSLLIVFNGGKITEEELLAWAALGREQPGRWPVLLIRGSGRTADKYANDQEFLNVSPSVHVVDCNALALRAKLEQLKVFSEH